ncbi:MAG TPA: type II toxin-antitoxin system death-on-curing family toxin [Xanthomonadales bacterium]|nr:type II toxin-antitoxin system death-on-curing family toxin [Xanthomonadales bacterium]
MPSEIVQFLSLDEAIAIHERLIDRFGGTPGLRDKGLLQSALFRPQTGYYEGLAQMATALFESLIINHPFVDGNKRMAFFACDVFLRLNGWKLKVGAKAGQAFIVGSLEKGQCDFNHLLPWIELRLEKL